jgi:serine protease Do
MKSSSDNEDPASNPNHPMHALDLHRQLRRQRWVRLAIPVLTFGLGVFATGGHGFGNAPAATPPPTTPAATVTPKTEKPEAARSISAAFATTAKALRPSVVRIDVEREAPRLVRAPKAAPEGPFEGIPPAFRRFFNFGDVPDFPEAPIPGPSSGTGSGFILDAAGHVVTNAHVVDAGDKLKVTLHDGQEISATLVGKDRRTDVAVVKLDRTPGALTAARLGDSSKLEVGEWVLAIGSPLGLEQTVTAGIVSGMGRVGRHVQMSGDRVREYIQTDAKINPGNSGGPLVSLDGEVVGMNTLIRVGAGGAYGFAVPVNEVKRVAQILIKDGRVRYPQIGVQVRDLDSLEPEVRAKLGKHVPDKGAFVAGVVADSPAAKAGIKAEDVLTKIDDRPIESAADVVDYVTSRSIGSTVKLNYLRGGESRTAKATLAEAPEDDRGEEGPLGLSLQTLTPSLAESLGMPSLRKGAVISGVAPGSVAEAAGLSPGDVIVEVDRKAVASAEEAAAALRAKRSGGHLLRVQGPHGSRFVALK